MPWEFAELTFNQKAALIACIKMKMEDEKKLADKAKRR